MPFILEDSDADNIPSFQSSLASVGDLEYKYPLDLDLVPGSELHTRLRTEIMSRAMASHSEMSKRYATWNKIDDTLTAYIPLDTEEENLKDKDSRRPVSIVVPLSYATLDTLLTYVVAAFFDDPIFKYEGVGSEDITGAMLLERVVGVQMRRAKAGIQVHTMFRDAFTYGFGAVAPIWSRHHGFKTTKKEDGFLSSAAGFLSKGFTKEKERVLKFEGNELYNIDPYSFLPDVNVPIQDVQRGEYVGWLRRENRTEILDRERDNGTFFNGKYIKEISGRSVLGIENSRRDKDGVREEGTRRSSTGQPVDVIYQYIDLIPAEWGVGRSDYPEKWLFALAGDQVIISAGPTNLDHDMFPVAVCAPDYDGYSATPISKLELVYGMQHLVDFLYNSHVANVRKAINDMFVVDPEMVNLNDLRNPAPGKLIRLRKKAWGRGVQNAVEQLKVLDITAGNIAESGIVGRMMDESTGATDAIKGLPRQGGERVSATEFRDTRGSALSRLEKAARIAGMQSIHDLGYMVGSQTQQFMTKEQYVKIAGRYEDELRATFGVDDRVMVSPYDLLIDYDVEVQDGSLPTSGDPQLWSSIFQITANDPELREVFDIVNIFKHTARLMGGKNIDQFVKKQGINAQVMQDADVEEAARRGDVVPLRELDDALN
jgi:hypothetical protein